MHSEQHARITLQDRHITSQIKAISALPSLACKAISAWSALSTLRQFSTSSNGNHEGSKERDTLHWGELHDWPSELLWRSKGPRAHQRESGTQRSKDAAVTFAPRSHASPKRNKSQRFPGITAASHLRNGMSWAVPPERTFTRVNLCEMGNLMQRQRK